MNDTLDVFENGPSNDVVKKLQKRSSLHFSEERQQLEDLGR